MRRITHGLPKNANTMVICDAACGFEVSGNDNNTELEETIFLAAVVQFGG